ncbi:hypothetical protein DFQ14_101372 [Halopolyspora algeriensis]|uniref:Uncharacterized protein n=1 Tax=Halopolyspora algeriensis TaxID=1500506 RepID=A0A368VXU5_9ACTN|nr:hypothetical protein DFQ14_101372 [Halopolyspora algeriensis]TQM48115.1 hypothetical protein FHU43_3077 [Halopolyspora algeriensis]
MPVSLRHRVRRMESRRCFPGATAWGVGTLRGARHDCRGGERSAVAEHPGIPDAAACRSRSAEWGGELCAPPQGMPRHRAVPRAAMRSVAGPGERPPRAEAAMEDRSGMAVPRWCPAELPGVAGKAAGGRACRAAEGWGIVPETIALPAACCGAIAAGRLAGAPGPAPRRVVARRRVVLPAEDGAVGPAVAGAVGPAAAGRAPGVPRETPVAAAGGRSPARRACRAWTADRRRGCRPCRRRPERACGVRRVTTPHRTVRRGPVGNSGARNCLAGDPAAPVSLPSLDVDALTRTLAMPHPPHVSPTLPR